MTNKIYCKSCLKFKDSDKAITRIDAAGNKKIRCGECVAKVKAAKVKAAKK